MYKYLLIQERHIIQMAYLLLPVDLHYMFYLTSAQVYNQHGTLIVMHHGEHTVHNFGIIRSTVLYHVWHTEAVPSWSLELCFTDGVCLWQRWMKELF